MIYLGLFELAEKSDVTLVGEVVAVGAESATLKVTGILSGEWKEESANVAPITMTTCTGHYTHFKIGEEVLVLGRKTANGQLKLDESGWGKRTLTDECRDDAIALARLVLDTLKLPAHDQKLAMLEAARSRNTMVRSEASTFISRRISDAENKQKYASQLVALLNDSLPEVQRIGLQALRFAKVPEAHSRIIELSRSDDIGVVTDASLCLSPINTPDSIAARIALASHSNPEVRIRACIDLDNCRTAEAKVALAKLLHDKDAKVRAMAPRGFVYWLRDNNAEDVLPSLLELLADENAEVRASAADKLGECIRADLVPPLLAVIKKPDQDAATLRAAFQSLYCQYSKGKSEGRTLIDVDIQVIIDAVKSSDASESYGPAFHSIGILDLCTKAEAKETLRWAAQLHPNTEIRAYAAHSLSRPR